MRLVRDEFTSVQPLGERVVVFPPKGWRVRKQTFFLPCWIDEGNAWEGEPHLQDGFPDEGHAMGVASVTLPGVNGTCYAMGMYGSRWPTDPARRAEAMAGGYVEFEGDPKTNVPDLCAPADRGVS